MRAETEPDESNTALSQSQRPRPYKALLPDSFRLLDIQPGLPESVISAQLFQCTLSWAPPYDAISYVWGDEQSTVTITCDGSPFQVTHNLHWALSRLRHTNHSRLVWADVVCIDQSNLKERSHQISLMGQIYSGAQHVFACLGPASRKQAREVFLLVDQNRSMKSLAKISSLKPSNPRWRDPRWKCMGELTGRPWFTRAWVLQEVGLAKDPRILFGSEEFSYRDLIAVMRVLPLPLAAEHNIRLRLIHMEWAEWPRLTTTNEVHPTMRHSKYTFLDLLAHASSSLTCKDPRDRIYAFLGHPLSHTANGRLIIRPDYEKDTHAIYLDLSTQLLRIEGLRVLTKVNSTEQSLSEGLPSWVVRWDACKIGNYIHKNLGSPFNASAGRLQSSKNFIHDDGRLLKLRGTEIDTVATSWRILLSTDTHQYDNYEDGNGRIILESALLKYLNDKSISYTSAYTRSRKHAFLSTITLSTTSTKDSRPTREQLETRKATWCHNRTFFVTEKGWYGLGPDIVKEGDVCGVLWGIDVPMILRPCEGGERWKVMGEAYMRDFMDGEVEGMLHRGDTVEREFQIC